MKKSLVVGVMALAAGMPLIVLAFAPAPDAGSRSVDYKSWKGYAEAREAGLKGDASFLALTSHADFTRIFAPVLTPRGAPDAIPKDAFDKQLFVAAIKRDGVFWDYKVEKVTANGDTLTVHYRSTRRDSSSEAQRGETRKAEFVSTAKAVGTAKATATARPVAETRKADPAPPRGITAKASPAPARGDTVKVGDSQKAPPRVGATLKADAVTAPTSGPGSRVDSPLILSVARDRYLTVIFMENGKKVGTARVNN
jgi:hypothetical protein